MKINNLAGWFWYACKFCDTDAFVLMSQITHLQTDALKEGTFHYYFSLTDEWESSGLSSSYVISQQYLWVVLKLFWTSDQWLFMVFKQQFELALPLKHFPTRLWSDPDPILSDGSFVSREQGSISSSHNKDMLNSWQLPERVSQHRISRGGKWSPGPDNYERWLGIWGRMRFIGNNRAGGVRTVLCLWETGTDTPPWEHFIAKTPFPIALPDTHAQGFKLCTLKSLRAS